ncbi:lipoprotein [Xanthobacter sp. KR7-65]|uniref:LPS translocon maturation chaperone LptM n=1 Tax=Xanthobacter sp. KR7-65 TaxID=3156612 RepID=UPI0032B36F46
MRSLVTLMALCGTLALAACGVKGPLEPPPGAQVAAPPPQAPPSASTAATPRTAAQFNDSATPHADWQKQKTTGSSSSSQKLLQGVQRPDQPFILDGLL